MNGDFRYRRVTGSRYQVYTKAGSFLGEVERRGSGWFAYRRVKPVRRYQDRTEAARGLENSTS